MAKELGVSPGLVSTWERRHERRVPAYWGQRIRELHGCSAQTPTVDELAKLAVVALVSRSPGLSLSALLQELDHSKATRRAITQLSNDGAVVTRVSWDRIGRTVSGYYLDSHPVASNPRPRGRELRMLRQSTGRTASEIGELLGVRANTVTRWETGTRNCPPERLAALIRILESVGPS